MAHEHEENMINDFADVTAERMTELIIEARAIIGRALLNVCGDNWKDDAAIFVMKAEDVGCTA